MIDPNEITDAVLDELTVIAESATQDEWQFGHTGTADHEAAIVYMADMISKRDSADLWMVFCGDPDKEPIVPAYTGNGPTSEANAYYLCAAQPVNVLRLIAEIKRERNEIRRLTRLLDTAQIGM